MSNKIFITPEELATPLHWGYFYENAFFAINRNPDCLLVHALVGKLKDGEDPRIIADLEKSGELTDETRRFTLEKYFDFVPYAWIEENEADVNSKEEVSLFDPSHTITCHRDAWYKNKAVIEEVKYTIEEANEAMTANNHFGPWNVSRITI